MIDWWLNDDWMMIDWLVIDWWLFDDWLMIDWWLIDDWLVDDLLMIDWWLIDDWLMTDWWLMGWPYHSFDCVSLSMSSFSSRSSTHHKSQTVKAKELKF